ncbi:MAG: hypothetical protein WAT93_14620 [Pontixanthobacter sp.]
MDNVRGNFGSVDDYVSQDDFDGVEDDAGSELPPVAIGTDERRMQVRAYNHWASLLDDRNFPSIEDLEPSELPDFGPYSVLLDFTSGIEDPAILYLGKSLAGECGTDVEISQLSDVPSRSLLSRITDHYMQILANQAPIGFEAEFVNQRAETIAYRGILLPYSSDGETIDFIYGVINWKELADQITTDELLLEIDQALDGDEAMEEGRDSDPVTDWADGPSSETGTPIADLPAVDDFADFDMGDDTFPSPEFGSDDYDEESHGESFEEDDIDVVARLSSLIQPRGRAGKMAFVDESEMDDDDSDWDLSEIPLTHTVESIAAIAPDYSDAAPVDEDHDELGSVADITLDPEAGLYDCLAEARELAQAACTSEDRTRATLYAAVGRAYDVNLAAQESPEEYEELVAENGLIIQERAPMTPVVKLVFGADYDKTRLTEYASVLSHAQRIGIERGQLSGFLAAADGGLKAVVQAERRIRKEESGKAVEPLDVPKSSIAKKLRKIEGVPLDSIDPKGAEFGVLMIRRLTTGEIIVLGEVSDDIPLVERVARKLIR